jgi:hypothetical protein
MSNRYFTANLPVIEINHVDETSFNEHEIHVGEYFTKTSYHLAG